MNYKLLLFDLDGTLLRSDKTISTYTLQTLQKCREKGLLIGVSTSRSEQNSLTFIDTLNPDILITSGGALVKYCGAYVFTAEFTAEETCAFIRAARDLCGDDCEITVDTINAHYWNYKINPLSYDSTWGDVIYPDYDHFTEKALKICVQTTDPQIAKTLVQKFPNCDCIKFADIDWYKFTKKDATKENAILKLCEACHLSPDEIIAFGDDLPDVGMLKMCGLGIAMGNALDEVKDAADLTIKSNDEDGIAKFLTEYLLQKTLSILP